MRTEVLVNFLRSEMCWELEDLHMFIYSGAVQGIRWTRPIRSSFVCSVMCDRRAWFLAVNATIVEIV